LLKALALPAPKSGEWIETRLSVKTLNRPGTTLRVTKKEGGSGAGHFFTKAEWRVKIGRQAPWCTGAGVLITGAAGQHLHDVRLLGGSHMTAAHRDLLLDTGALPGRIGDRSTAVAQLLLRQRSTGPPPERKYRISPPLFACGPWHRGKPATQRSSYWPAPKAPASPPLDSQRRYVLVAGSSSPPRIAWSSRDYALYRLRWPTRWPKEALALVDRQRGRHRWVLASPLPSAKGYSRVLLRHMSVLLIGTYVAEMPHAALLLHLPSGQVRGVRFPGAVGKLRIRGKRLLVRGIGWKVDTPVQRLLKGLSWQGCSAEAPQGLGRSSE
jgi:hypothetical protein